TIISASSNEKTGKKRKLLALTLFATVVLSLFLMTRYVTAPTDVGGDETASVAKAVPMKKVLPKEEKGPSPGVSEKRVDVGILYQKALGYQQNKNLERAERLYKNILNRDPEYVFVLNNLGVIYMGTKRDEEAKAMFEKAIVHSKDYVDPYYNLACIYSKRGDLPKSLDYLKAAVQLNNSVKKWVKNDKDLENVSSLEEFREIAE
ncbi:MAG: tetratricopeptide repeat protein, partial [Deltaproteobacteria bacterium]|nr:tetratricopeptide repeat protein [Deltaproteobacteria bacterium]